MSTMIESLVTPENHLRFLKNLATDPRLCISLSDYEFSDNDMGCGCFLDVPDSHQTIGKDRKTGKAAAFYQTMATEDHAIRNALTSNNPVRGMLIGREKTPQGPRDVFLVIPASVIALLDNHGHTRSHTKKMDHTTTG